MSTRKALEAFERRYEDRIPADMYKMVGKEVRWANRVRWERLNLARLGFLDNTRKGIWAITEKGRHFIEEHPEDALQILQEKIAEDAVRQKENRKNRAISSDKTSSFIEIPQKTKTLKHRSQDRRRASSQSQASPELDSAHKILGQEIQRIRDYLHGVTSIQTSDEVLCDWIHFCYTFGLFKEGALLFPMISGEEVNPWYMERTRKFARLCAMKASTL
jgi:hypothetical protein